MTTDELHEIRQWLEAEDASNRHLAERYGHQSGNEYACVQVRRLHEEVCRLRAGRADVPASVLAGLTPAQRDALADGRSLAEKYPALNPLLWLLAVIGAALIPVWAWLMLQDIVRVLRGES